METINEILKSRLKLVAEFMELGTIGNEVYVVFLPDVSCATEFIMLSDLKFHTNWSWLMTALRKVPRLGKKVFGVVTIYDDRCIIHCYKNEVRVHTIDVLDGINTEPAFVALCEFIEWYNANKL